LSDKEDSSESILVNTESIVEKLTNDIINPCKTLPNCDVVGQETSRPSIIEIVDLKSPNKSIEATFSTDARGATKQRQWCPNRSNRGGQPGLTAAPRLLQNKSKLKMVKLKKPEIGVWKTIESKGRKHQREKPKSNEKLPAKSQRQNNVNGVSRSKNSKRPKPSPREKFHNENRQWSNSHKSMSFPLYGSSTPMPWKTYFNMHYFCPPWYYNSYMGSPSYFGPNYITHREPVINEPSSMRSDCFDHKNRLIQKK
jgi:hypothetical protein